MIDRRPQVSWLSGWRARALGFAFFTANGVLRFWSFYLDLPTRAPGWRRCGTGATQVSYSVRNTVFGSARIALAAGTALAASATAIRIIPTRTNTTGSFADW